MEDLDARKQTILRAIVIEYVGAAEPIGSEMLVQKYELGVKSATVRNEMAEMSEMGYLEQPHTSAGRIPSDAGYRFYVDRLLEQSVLTPDTKGKVQAATNDGEALQGLLRDTATVLSRFAHLLTVATTLRDRDLLVRSAILSALGPAQALLVLVLNNGHVENRVVECPPGLTLDDVGRANDALRSAIVGQSLGDLSKAKTPPATGNAPSDRLLGTIWGNLRAMARDLTRGQMVAEGEEFLFAQPEFQRDAGSLTELLDQLFHSELLYEAIATPSEGPATQTVTIGRENRFSEMHQLSVVRNTFYVGEKEAGVIAIVGPTRMAYETSIPLVSYTARALSDSLTRFFG